MSHYPPLSLESEGSWEKQDQFESGGLYCVFQVWVCGAEGEDGNRETLEAPSRGQGALLTARLSCTQAVPPPASRTPAAHRHTRLDGEGDLRPLIVSAPPGASQRKGFSTQASGGGGCRWSREGSAQVTPAGTFLSSGHTASLSVPGTRSSGRGACPTMSMEALSNCSIS